MPKHKDTIYMLEQDNGAWLPFITWVLFAWITKFLEGSRIFSLLIVEESHVRVDYPNRLRITVTECIRSFKCE